MDWKILPQLITAIGALGTAAFGLVDASKAVFPFINSIGFGRIKKTVQALTPGKGANALSQGHIVETLRSNWINGTDLNGQKAIAKKRNAIDATFTWAASLCSTPHQTPASHNCWTPKSSGVAASGM